MPEGTVTTLRKVASSALVEFVDAALNSAHFATQLDSRQSFYSIVGMSGVKYRFFINTLIKSLDAAASYLEVGSWAGSTLCSAIHGNKVRAVAIDNWSEFGGPRDAFLANVKTFTTPGADVKFIESDFRKVDYTAVGLFNVYLFDGPHEQKDQYDGLSLALPALRDEFVFIVDDWNWLAVRKGTLQAIRDTKLDVRYAAEIRSTLDETYPTRDCNQSDWHNGYYISVLSKSGATEGTEHSGGGD